MRKWVWLFVPVLTLQCTRQIEKIITPPPAQGTVVGVVEQNESHARVYARQVAVVDSAEIDPTDGSFRIDGLPAGNYDILVKADHYGSTWVRFVQIESGGVTYLGEISLSVLPDGIDAHYPEDRAEVVFDRRWSRLTVSISFDTPMDRASVEAAFSTLPPTEGTFAWNSYYSTPDPIYFADENRWDAADKGGAEITTFTKINSFTYRMARRDCYTDTTYEVTLSTAAKDTAGTPLEFPLTFSFSTVQSASSQNTIITLPEHGDIYVDPMSNASLYIMFPRRMDQASTEAAIHIDPATDIIPVWPEGNQVRLYTGGPLRCARVYEITIDSTARDLDGIPLGEPFTFSFETAPVELESTSPQNGQIFVSTDAVIALRFNTYMILSSVRSAFIIEPTVSGTFQRGFGRYDTDSKDAITFFPDRNMNPNTKYTVTIQQDAKDLHGSSLPEPVSFTFVTEPE